MANVGRCWPMGTRRKGHAAHLLELLPLPVLLLLAPVGQLLRSLVRARARERVRVRVRVRARVRVRVSVGQLLRSLAKS